MFEGFQYPSGNGSIPVTINLFSNKTIGYLNTLEKQQNNPLIKTIAIKSLKARGESIEALGMRTRPPSVQFTSFSCSVNKKAKKPLGLAPPSGKSWIRH